MEVSDEKQETLHELMKRMFWKQNNVKHISRLKYYQNLVDQEKKEKSKLKGQILTLPDEVLLKIFGHLSTYNILTQIALVCKDFHRLSKDPTLITEIYLSPKVLEQSSYKIFVQDVIQRSSCLTTFIIGEFV